MSEFWASDSYTVSLLSQNKQKQPKNNLKTKTMPRGKPETWIGAKYIWRAGKMVHWVKYLLYTPGDLNSIPGTHIKRDLIPKKLFSDLPKHIVVCMLTNKYILTYLWTSVWLWPWVKVGRASWKVASYQYRLYLRVRHGVCLSQCSITLERHHDHGNS